LETAISTQVEWAKRNDLPSKVYPCGHVAIPISKDLELPNDCPWCTPQKIKPENCPSTHGAAGYALGSYIRSDGKVVCGLCGTILEPRKEAIGSWMPKQP